MTMKLPETLQELGLSDKESEVYMTLLSTGLTTTAELIKKCDLNRSTIYTVLEKLEDRRLVTTKENDGVKKYQPISPEKLAEIASSMVKESSKNEELVNNLLPKLKSIYKGTKKKPTVQIFEGKEGLIEAYDDVFQTGTLEYRAFSSPVHTTKEVKEYFLKHRQKRIKMKIKIKAIHPVSKLIIKEMSRERKLDQYGESMLIPVENYSLTSDIAVYKNRLTIVSPRKEIAVIIESKEIADVVKEMFDLAFEEAKRLAKQEEYQPH